MKRLNIPVNDETLEGFKKQIPRGFRSEIIRRLICATTELVKTHGSHSVMLLLTNPIKIIVSKTDEK